MTHHSRERVLGFIIEYKKKNDGCAPTYREIMAGCEITSSSLCQYILRKLEADGKIVLDGRAVRNIRVVGGQWVCR